MTLDENMRATIDGLIVNQALGPSRDSRPTQNICDSRHTIQRKVARVTTSNESAVAFEDVFQKIVDRETGFVTYENIWNKK